jgi:predicted Zn-ribbon and HTH transcriptional regulator
MKPNCERCGCEDLDQGIDRSLRCTKCNHIMQVFGRYYDIADIEKLK